MHKFTLSQLSASGMNQWEARLCVGKSIPVDILTYLKNQSENLREKFMVAEPRLTLSGMTNSNHTKIEEMTERMETLERIVTDQAKEKRAQDIKIEVLTDAITEQQELIQFLVQKVKELT